MLQQPQSVSGDEDGDGDYGGGEEGWPEGDDYITGNEEVGLSSLKRRWV